MLPFDGLRAFCLPAEASDEETRSAFLYVRVWLTAEGAERRSSGTKRVPRSSTFESG